MERNGLIWNGWRAASPLSQRTILSEELCNLSGSCSVVAAIYRRVHARLRCYGVAATIDCECGAGVGVAPSAPKGRSCYAPDRKTSVGAIAAKRIRGLTPGFAGYVVNALMALDPTCAVIAPKGE
jgi:hypothetical protein